MTIVSTAISAMNDAEIRDLVRQLRAELLRRQRERASKKYREAQQ